MPLLCKLEHFRNAVAQHSATATYLGGTRQGRIVVRSGLRRHTGAVLEGFTQPQTQLALPHPHNSHISGSDTALPHYLSNTWCHDTPHYFKSRKTTVCWWNMYTDWFTEELWGKRRTSQTMPRNNGTNGSNHGTKGSAGEPLVRRLGSIFAPGFAQCHTQLTANLTHFLQEK